MRFSESTRRYITAGVVCVVVVGLVVASVMGKKQDVVFQTDEQLYQLAVQQLQEGNYEIALGGMATLEEHQKTSENVHYVTALAAANAGEIDKGVRHMQRVLDINPHKVEDSIFMLQYAEILLQSETAENAALVLERCETLPVPESYPDYQERVAQLQAQLAAQS